MVNSDCLDDLMDVSFTKLQL